MDNFEKGDLVILLDRSFGHPTKIRGIIVGLLSEDTFNVLLSNGYGKGKIKKVRSFDIKKNNAEN
jgi:hypothetical protein